MKHREDTAAFQKRYTLDVKKVIRDMVANPFQLDTLARINNSTIQFDDEVVVDLRFLDIGEEQVKQFWEDRLVKAVVPIDAKVTKIDFCLPGKFEGKKKEDEKKLVYSNSVLTKLRSVIEIRPEITKKVFQTELFGVAQSLTQTNTKLYHGTKSKIVEQFEKSEYNID